MRKKLLIIGGGLTAAFVAFALYGASLNSRRPPDGTYYTEYNRDPVFFIETESGKPVCVTDVLGKMTHIPLVQTNPAEVFKDFGIEASTKDVHLYKVHMEASGQTEDMYIGVHPQNWHFGMQEFKTGTFAIFNWNKQPVPIGARNKQQP